MSSMFPLSPSAQVTFCRDGSQQKLLHDPAFVELFLDLEAPIEQVGVIVRKFLAYVGDRPTSPHLFNLTPEHFFWMAEGVNKNQQLRVRLTLATQRLVQEHLLSFIAKPIGDTHSTLIRLIEVPTQQTANECLEEISNRINQWFSNQIYNLEELGKLLLEGDLAIKFIARCKTDSILWVNDSVELVKAFKTIEKKIGDILKRSSLSAYKHTTTPAWERLKSLLKEDAPFPKTPDSYPGTPLYPPGFVAFLGPNGPERSSFLLPDDKKK